VSGRVLDCRDERRRDAVRQATLNGLDYLEVSGDQLTLTVYFLGKAPGRIAKENVRIEGGERVTDIRVVDLTVQRQDDPETDDWMEVTVDRLGDFSTYTLRLIALDERGRPTGEPLQGFDPRYASLDFSFKAGCPSELDCRTEPICPPPDLPVPDLSYLAKDYASFRQLVLDRLALVMPEWRERHVPDVMLALVEVLSYAGDHLSYYQDAVATEAYLDTARQRISLRRHARLVDYPMHEGCNARAWVCIETESEFALDRRATFFVTDYPGAPSADRVLSAADLSAASPRAYEVFEPLVDRPDQPILISPAHSKISFYTWGDRECCLLQGATTATLRDDWVAPSAGEPGRSRRLRLAVGDVLVFEEVIGPGTGNQADADPRHRHAVRLTKVEPGEDPLDQQPVVDISWAAADALPFPLCLSTIVPPECAALTDVTVARGNVILVDHGATVHPPEDLGTVPGEAPQPLCEDEGEPAETRTVPGPFRPRMARAPLTRRELLKSDTPATLALTQDPRAALPAVALTTTLEGAQGAAPREPRTWTPRRDLLGSASDDEHFVVEVDNGAVAHLRFGDGELGRQPEAGVRFTATYRVGNGLAGNVGPESITHLVLRSGSLSGVSVRVRNPLAAAGGVGPELIPTVKLLAPYTFRLERQRAITAPDYAELAERNPAVQRAAAALRWTGSWYEAEVGIDPLGKVEADQMLLDALAGFLYRFRRIGHDLVVQRARSVALDLELSVCVLPHALRGHVRAALLDTFSNRVLANGRRGFFHPDNLTFGEGVFVSKLVAAAHAVPGVQSVTVTRLRRLGERDSEALVTGVLKLGPLEVARLDNDPSFPEHGQLIIDIGGGR